MEKEVITETLCFNESYPDFMTFYTTCEETMYRKIIEMYKNLSDNEERILNIKASFIDGLMFESKLNVRRSDLTLMQDVILPFFERTENYEVCDDIIKNIL